MSKPVICIGGALVDELLYNNSTVIPATTNMASATKSAGGVARNIAEQLSILSVPTHLIAVFGDDADGRWLKKHCSEAGIMLNNSIIKEGLTGKYTGIIDDKGHLYSAFLSNASDYMITPEYLEQQTDLLKTAAFLLADTNITTDTLNWLLNYSRKTHIPLIIEPVSVPPARKLKESDLEGLYLITPNEDELPALCSNEKASKEDCIKELLQRGVRHIWYHNGKEGSSIYSKEDVIHLASPEVEMIDCTGAGDASLSGFVLGKYLGKSDTDALKIAHTLSAETIKVKGSIAKHIDQQQLLKLSKAYYP